MVLQIILMLNFLDSSAEGIYNLLLSFYRLINWHDSVQVPFKLNS